MSENKPRDRLFKELDEALDLFHKKTHRSKKVNAYEQQGWGRLLLKTISVYGKLLDTEELEQRVEKLEAQLKDGVLIPNEKH